MTRDDRRFAARAGRRGPFRRESVELLDVGLRPSDHVTRLWPADPAEQGAVAVFLLAMFPLRIAALALLWATSAPWRVALAFLCLAVLIAL